MIDIGGHSVNRVGIDARGEQVAAPIENVSPLGWRGYRPHLLAGGPRHEVGVPKHLEKYEPRLDADDPHADDHRRDEDPPLTP